MADILEQLLGVEKRAAALVAEAEAEAVRRKSSARLALAQEHAAALRDRAAAVETEVGQERAKTDAERQERNRAFREGLGQLPIGRVRFAAVVRSFLAPSP